MPKEKKDFISADDARKLAPKAAKKQTLAELDALIRNTAAKEKLNRHIVLNYPVDEEARQLLTDKKYKVNVNRKRNITIIKW